MDKNKHFELNQVPYIVLIIVIFGYFLYIGQRIPAIIILLTLIILFIVLNTMTIFKTKEWDKFVEDAISKLKPNVVDLATNIDYPVVGFTKDGNIYWYNKKFKSLFDEDTKLSDIEDIIDIDLEKVWKSDFPKTIEIANKTFDVNGIKYKAAQDEFEEDLMILHLVDITKIKEAEDKKIVTILLEVDNFSEVLNSTPEDKRPVLAGEIERELLNYANSLKGYMKRYSNNKAIIIAPFEVLRDEIKAKFPILDIVKKIDQGNTLEPTISMGIAYDNGSSIEDGEAATKAKELALGRGGDQVVIKVGEKLSFFGGNSREMEKKSKVRSRVITHALRDLILESENVYIMGHKNPDMDSLGAAVGIYTISRALNKNAHILMDEPHRNVNDLLEKLFEENDEYNDVLIPSEEVMDKISERDLLIVVDVHSIGYVLNSELASRELRKVVIDHHRRAQDAITGAIINYIETYASSTSELVTEMIQYIIEKPKLNKAESDALLSGIWVDTKGFYYKTGVRTFEAASFLRKSGANTIDIRGMFSYDKDLYLLKADIIRDADVENGIAIAICPEGISDPVIVAQVSDELLNIKGIHTSFVLAQIGEDVNISARSLGDLNVQVITEEFGGGGHSTMSGAKVLGTTSVEVKDRLKEIIKNIEEEEVEKNESDSTTGRQERR